MVDLSRLFDKSISQRDKFLARLLGLFSEDIIRIWTRDPSSSYMDLGRPTITQLGTNKRYTLDFTLSLKLPKKPQTRFVTEMKSWTEYENYKYLNLAASGQLEKLNVNPAFKAFLSMAKEREKFVAKLSREEITYDGLILIWSRAEPSIIENVKQAYGLYDVLTLENILCDLNEWDNQEYKDFIGERAEWCNYLFQTFSAKP